MRKCFIYVIAKHKVYAVSNKEARNLIGYKDVKEILTLDKYQKADDLEHLKRLEFKQIDVKKIINYLK